MKEFIEKLIERLEEEIKENTNEDMSCKILYFGLSRALRIVNELAEEYKPKTQADKIMVMSDEELAQFLVNFKNTFGEEYEGKMSCLDWLKSEIEVDKD